MDNLIQRPNTSMSKVIMTTFFQEPWLPATWGMVCQPSVGNSWGGVVTSPADALLKSLTVDAKSNQQVNIYRFAVRCDRMWHSTQWHRVYTGSGNVPYVQFQSVGDFIPEPRCSKFAVGLEMSGNKVGVLEVRSDSVPKGREWRELLCALSIGTYALCSCWVLELWSYSNAQVL